MNINNTSKTVYIHLSNEASLHLVNLFFKYSFINEIDLAEMLHHCYILHSLTNTLRPITVKGNLFLIAELWAERGHLP